MLGTGSVSALSYGSKLAGVASTIATMAIGTAVLPEFSRKIAEGAWGPLRRAWRLYAIAILAVLVPVCAALAWLSLPLARLFFERGAFGAPATQAVAWVQRFALLEPPIAVLLALVSRLATALGANSLLLRISLAGALVNFGGDWLLARMLGVAGIPIASAAARLVSLLVLLWLLRQREPRLFGDKRH
jgi:putative peptidoglycan lipid II flippase